MLTALVLAALAAGDDVVFSHFGATDPVQEGWVESNFGPGFSVGPIIDPPVEAWFVNDTVSMPGAGGGYFRLLSDCQVDAIDAEGWTLRVCLRVVDPEDEIPTPWVGYANGDRRFAMWFTTAQGSGDPIVQLQLGNPAGCGISFHQVVVTNDDAFCHAPEFHLYELVYDPERQDTTLFIDGQERFVGYTGHTNGFGDFMGVGWGAGSSCAIGYAEYHSVELAAVGELPSPDVDCNGDCELDVLDFVCFQMRFAKQDPWADCNADGDLNILDFVCYQLSFQDP